MRQSWKGPEWWGEVAASACTLLLVVLVTGKWLGFHGLAWWIVLAPAYVPIACYAVFVLVLAIRNNRKRG